MTFSINDEEKQQYLKFQDNWLFDYVQVRIWKVTKRNGTAMPLVQGKKKPMSEKC